MKTLGFIGISNETYLDIEEAVSYTHLDVYKRQVYKSDSSDTKEGRKGKNVP